MLATTLRWLRPAVTAFAVLALLSAPNLVSGQYFGRNKVQYRTFDFTVLRTEHFHLYFYPAEREAAVLAARMAERWYARFSKLLHHDLGGPQPIILYASHPEFEQTNVIAGELGEGVGGVTEAVKRRIVLPAGSSLAETDHTIGHELVHAFQYDITGEGGGGMGAASRLPLWFIEGMAEYFSLGHVDPNTAMWVRDAMQHKQLPTWNALADPRFFPYRWGQAFLAFIAGKYGDAAIGKMLTLVGRGAALPLAVMQVTSMKGDSLVKLWHREIEATYLPLEEKTRSPQAYGKLLVGSQRPTEGAMLNVAPALSPDGRDIVFFSSRGMFSIDLYRADAHTGQVAERILETALDQHFQSLEFINSSGAWDPNGRYLAFGAVSGGKAVLALFDVYGKEDGKRRVREIPVPEVGEIFNPTWSPDGRYVVFSALVGGFTDLYRYDLTAQKVERLTNDPFADVEPAWSPDGREIAFVTDRFTTRLSNLTYGRYGLAVMDARTRAVRRVATFPGAKSINPQWAPDGRSLYFVSDRNGISNVYRIEFPEGRITQVTNLFSGVSGITELSPTLSVAGQNGRLVFGVYQASGYNLYAIDSSAMLAGGPISDSMSFNPAALPPRERVPGELQTAMHNADGGLPTGSRFTYKPYRARMAVDFVSQPSLAIGASSFGTYVGGGIAVFWSDMLGNHNLVTAAQVNGGLQDFSGLIAYQNSTHRWNWGIVGQQLPFYTYRYIVTSEPVRPGSRVETQHYYRETDRQLSFIASYPFTPAQRFEMSAGVVNASFSEQVQTRGWDVNGVPLYDSLQTVQGPPGMTLATTSAALVYDNALVGATSPLVGQRFRLEVSPTAGTLSWIGLLADLRNYFMPLRPFTFAMRALVFGRYGSGAEDPRMTPLYVGYPSLMRGYDIGSFSSRECRNNICPTFNRLHGSRVVVGNAELRFPLLGALGLGSGFYGGYPVEMAFFADGGMAYCSGKSPLFCTGDSKPVFSTGVAMRVNLFGFAVGEFDWVKPMQRPEKGWYLEMSLTQGF